MSDEATGTLFSNPDTTTTTDATTTDTTTTSTDNGIFGEGWNLKEGWAETVSQALGPDDASSFDIKNEPSLKNIKSFPDAIKQLLNAQHKIGADKVVAPKEGASEGEFHDYFKRVGKPDTVQDYTLPENKEFPLDKENQAALRERFFKENFTQSQANAAMEMYYEEIQAAQTALEEKQSLEKSETGDKLKKDWGANFDPISRRIDNFSRNTGIYDTIANQGLQHNYSFVKMLETVSGLFQEDSGMLAAHDQHDTPQNAAQKIKEIRLNSSHPYHKKDPDALKYMEQLYKDRAAGK